MMVGVVAPYQILNQLEVGWSASSHVTEEISVYGKEMCELLPGPKSNLFFSLFWNFIPFARMMCGMAQNNPQNVQNTFLVPFPQVCCGFLGPLPLATQSGHVIRMPKKVAKFVRCGQIGALQCTARGMLPITLEAFLFHVWCVFWSFCEVSHAPTHKKRHQSEPKMPKIQQNSLQAAK